MGRTNSWKVTMVDTGFPGRPKNGVRSLAVLRLAEDHRLARLNQRTGEKKSCAQRSQHLLDQVVFAHGDATGQQQQVGGKAFADQQTPDRRHRRERWGESPARRRRCAPARPANSCWSCGFRLALAAGSHPPVRRRWPGSRPAAVDEPQSPDVRSQRQPQPSRGSMRVPRATITSPWRASAAAGTTFSPARVARSTVISSPSRRVYSTITTESAPAGTGAPVMISTACFEPTATALSSGDAPALIEPMQRSLAGSAARSADRTAYPSRVERGKGRKIAVGAQVFGQGQPDGIQQRQELCPGRSEVSPVVLDDAASLVKRGKRAWLGGVRHWNEILLEAGEGGAGRGAGRPLLFPWCSPR